MRAPASPRSSWCETSATMRIDKGEWENALFILTSVMSHAKPDKAICDAGLKAHAVDSGLPFVYGRDDVKYVKCSDEHGVIDDPKGVLKINDKLRLVPGHCDPTCNVHDWYVGIRKGKVETLWPISARGRHTKDRRRVSLRTDPTLPQVSPSALRQSVEAPGLRTSDRRR